MAIQLIVVQGRPEGKALRFPPGQYYFGRGAECHVRPNSDWVSRQHCLLRVTREGAWLRDLGSRNGTLVNGELVAGERLLAKGDQIQVGPLVFEVRPDSAAAAQVATSLSSDTNQVADPGAPTRGPDTLATTDTHPVLPKSLEDLERE
ncbi:MAG TPA: FHA domain-containing protein [Gemmataceae bacterium]|jgi:pSer/pThr/pTyr-binding forkhead associated (FHA) protein|nr:FHA domain-containing protein [Gemmataceae bacterium]